MIPLRDVDRRPTDFPMVTTIIVAVNALVFIIELVRGPSFITRWSLKPADIASGHELMTTLTAMFMHAGWLHIIGNMVFLWAFGPEIEDVMGRRRYLAFYLLAGMVAMIAQVVASPASRVPSLGASGAIARVMGAFLIIFPRDRIRTLLFIFFFVTIAVIPAIVLVGLWFLIQLFSEVGAVVEHQAGGIAYMAHIGGFLFGVLTARLFETHRKRPRPIYRFG